MNVRITVLCDNCVGPLAGTIGEHGFAALVEAAGGESILFDTGQGLSLLHNARRMGRDLGAVRKVVISHGHYDHGGGLLPLLKEHGAKLVFGDERIFMPRHRIKDNGDSYPIGLQFSREELEESGATFDLSAEFREISPGIHLSGTVPRVTSFENGDKGLYCDCAGHDPDTVPDDQSLVIETAKGLVILLGCCHAGLINSLEHITGLTGRKDIYAVIGGTHLGFCSQEQLDRSIAALKKFAVGKLAVSHCTGFAAAAKLSREMPQEFHCAMVGYTLEVANITR
jgi:7,8-dihydropterin-6-yl-methyl-4-(beta-D-ribofuranosyl)aminobenzene 5'-phosphate synthase